MRVTFSIVVSLAVACSISFYFFGYRQGIRESARAKELEGDIRLTLRMYQEAATNNWTQAQNTVRMVLLSKTRKYERSYGSPSGTNKFVHEFAQAKAISDKIESQLIPLTSLVTNLPVSSNLKTAVKVEK